MDWAPRLLAYVVGMILALSMAFAWSRQGLRPFVRYMWITITCVFMGIAVFAGPARLLSAMAGFAIGAVIAHVTAKGRE